MPTSLDDLAAVARAPGPDDAIEPRPPLVITLTGRPANDVQLAAVSEAAATGDILIGVATDGIPDPAVTERLTLTLSETAEDPRMVQVRDVDSALASLLAAIDSHPATANLLAAQLRLSARLGVRDALATESLTYSLLQAGPEHAKWLSGRSPRPPQAGPAPVRLERDGATLQIVLSRSDRRNALSVAVRDGLLEAFAVANADPDLEIVLRGEGPDFCSGGDLDEFGSLADPVSSHLIRTTRSPAWAAHQLRDRLTIKVHGRCLGAGVELPGFAGTVFADPGTTFRLPELSMGLIPGAGGTVSLPRRIGRWRTAWLALTGEPIDAATALAWGLVDALV